MDFMFVGAEGTFMDEQRAKAAMLMVICKDDGNLSATEVRTKTDEYVEMVLRFLSTYEGVEIKTDGEPSNVEIARRVQARRDKTTTMAQTSVGGHQEIGAVERANGTVQAQLRDENHSRYAVVSRDVAAFCLDGGALPVRSKNETDSVRKNKRLSIRISVGTMWRSGHGENCRCRQNESKQAGQCLGQSGLGRPCGHIK